MNDLKAGPLLFAMVVIAGLAGGWALWQRGQADHAARPPAPAPSPAQAEASPPVPPRGEERLVGHVEDDLGAPVAGAEVVATLEGTEGARWSARSGADGRFELAQLPAGSLTLEAQAPAHERAVLPEVAVPSAGELPPIVLERTGKLGGQVVLPSGAAAVGASVTLAGSGLWPPRTLQTDAEGRFRVAPLPGGIYEVRAGLGTLTSDPQEGITVEAGREALVSIELVEGATLRGQIYQAETGSPVAGARVTVGEDALTAVAHELQSDAEGRFALPGLRRLPHRVSIRAPGFVAVTSELRSPGEPEQRFALRRAGTLIGHVVDADGEPVAGAELEVLGTTDAGGELHMSPAALRFQRDLFETRLGAAAIGIAGDNLGVTRGAVPRIPLVASSGVAALGDGERADLQEDLLALRSDGEGRFQIEGVPPGRVQVVARRAGFAVARSEVRTLEAGARLEDLRIELSRGGSIQGRVVDARGFPVEAARIQLEVQDEPLSRVALSGADGSFGFGAALGRCVVSAHRAGTPPVRQELTVRPGELSTVELMLQGEARQLEGRVLGPRGFPVVGAIVRVEALDRRSPVARTTTSGGDGTFQVHGLPEPPYRVRVEHSGYAPATLEAAEPGDDGITVDLEAGAVLRGRVLDGFHDRPLAGARVELVGLGTGARHGTRTASDGSFEFRNLNRGSYLVSAKNRSYIAERRELEIGGDLEAEDFALAPAGSVSGEVVDRFGAPVFNAQVAIGDPPAWSSATRTDHRGHFALRGLPAGEHAVSARHPRAGETGQPAPVRVYTLQESPGLVLRLPQDAETPGGPVRAAPPGGAEAAPEEREGVAVRVGFRDGAVVVDAVAPGSRARAAGLRSGDRIERIDDETVHVASQARAMLRGDAGSRVVLEVLRGAQQRRLVVERERFVMP